MKRTLFIIFRMLLPGAALLGVSCSRAESGSHGAPAEPSVYSAEHIREVGASDYAAAMKLVDEGLVSGNISSFESDMLRARLTYQFTEDYDAAEIYCKRALDSGEAAEDSRARLDALYLLCSITSSVNDLSTCLAACTEGKELAHAEGCTFDMHAFDWQAGRCLFRLGQDEDGLEKMREAIDGAGKVAASATEYGHLANFVGNLIGCYSSVGKEEEVLAECVVYDQLITKMAALPGLWEDYIPRCRFYLELYRALAWKNLGDDARALEAYGAIDANPYSMTADARFRLAEYYAACGAVDTVRQILDEEVPYGDADTVCRSYRLRLRLMESAYRNAGRVVEADGMIARIDALSDLIDLRDSREQTAVSAARYDTQAYRLTLSDTLASVRRNRIIDTIIIVLVLAVFGSCLYELRRRKLQAEENRLRTDKVEEQLANLQKKVTLIVRDAATAPEDGTDDSPASLASFIEGRKLYLHKDLSRSMAVDMMGISQQTMTRMLSEIQPELSFPDYIKSLRIKEALMLIQSNPDLSVTEIAERSGFYNIRTFQRAFQSITGKTPREYIKHVRQASR